MCEEQKNIKGFVSDRQANTNISVPSLPDLDDTTIWSRIFMQTLLKRFPAFPSINFTQDKLQQCMDYAHFILANPNSIHPLSGVPDSFSLVKPFLSPPPSDIFNRNMQVPDKNSFLMPDSPHETPILSDSSGHTLTTIHLYSQPLVCLQLDGHRRLCLAQISATLLRDHSYNEIHNRRVALGITCVQCTPAQLELLRRAGAMPVSSRRCGTITLREAERLVRSFLDEVPPPQLPEDFAFRVMHRCGWGARGEFVPSRYNSSRAKCIRCQFCQAFFSPNKFIFHCHRPEETGLPQLPSDYRHPDAANFNAWRRHLYLSDPRPNEDLMHAWEDVKAMFNGGNRKRNIHTPENSESPNPAALCSVNDGEHLSDNDYEPTSVNHGGELKQQPTETRFHWPPPIERCDWAKDESSFGTSNMSDSNFIDMDSNASHSSANWDKKRRKCDQEGSLTEEKSSLEPVNPSIGLSEKKKSIISHGVESMMK